MTDGNIQEDGYMIRANRRITIGEIVANTNWERDAVQRISEDLTIVKCAPRLSALKEGRIKVERTAVYFEVDEHNVSQ